MQSLLPVLNIPVFFLNLEIFMAEFMEFIVFNMKRQIQAL